MTHIVARITRVMIGNVNTTVMKNLFHTKHETRESKPNRNRNSVLQFTTVAVKLVKDTSYCIISNHYNG